MMKRNSSPPRANPYSNHTSPCFFSEEFIQPEESKSSWFVICGRPESAGRNYSSPGSLLGSLRSLRLKYFVNSCAFVKFVSRPVLCCGCDLRRAASFPVQIPKSQIKNPQPPTPL